MLNVLPIRQQLMLTPMRHLVTMVTVHVAMRRRHVVARLLVAMVVTAVAMATVTRVDQVVVG